MATPQGRLLFRLVVSMPRIDATEFGLWATPRTSDGTGGPRQLDEQGRRISKSNPDLKFGANLADQARMWPTPMASDHKGSGQNDTMRDRLDYAVEKPEGKRISGSLNPEFVEYLMGYPIGWTDLKD